MRVRTTNFWDCPFDLCASALSQHQSTLQEEHKLPKPNYQFEKRKREIEKKAKKEEKKLRKLQPDDPSPPKAETK
jgi:uridine kinase